MSCIQRAFRIENSQCSIMGIRKFEDMKLRTFEGLHCCRFATCSAERKSIEVGLCVTVGRDAHANDNNGDEHLLQVLERRSGLAQG